jgi:energy-coupling factor transporter ATP-binding protein EcfA2
MAMANVADIFARRGLRTAMIDFDLEAPGIERFFLSDPTPVRRNRGLLDLLLAYKRAMSGAPGEGEAEFRRLESFLVPIYRQLPSGGVLDLLPAGQRGDDEQLAMYAYHLRTFDWQEFYFEWFGELFFQWLRRELLNRYDVILVDSRTGMTEMGGICAYQLADNLVMFCAANSQNVQGTRDIIRNFQSPRVQVLRKDRPLDVVVVPARVQQNSRDIERFRTEFDRSFTPFTPPALTTVGQKMWDLMLPYEAAYAFEERLLTSEEDGAGLGAAFERLANTVVLLAPPDSRLRSAIQTYRPRSEGVPLAFDPTRQFAGWDAFISYNRHDEGAARHIATALADRGLNIWLDLWRLSPGEPLEAALERALDQSRAFVILIGPSEAGVWRKTEERMIIERSLVGREDFRLIPILLPGASYESIPTVLRSYVAVDFRASLDDEKSLHALAVGIRGTAPGPQRRATEEELIPYKGLTTYQEEDAQVFFGRGYETSEAVRFLLEKNFVALVGPAGSGKSSLVQAAIVPRLRSELAGLKVLFVRPGSDPFANLAPAVGELAGLDFSETQKFLQESPAGLATLIQLHVSDPVLVVIDQLEEIWYLVNAGTRTAFLQTIQRAIAVCRIVVILRADYYAAALREGLQDLFSAGQVNLGSMPSWRLRETIEEPARLAGLAFEPGLVERLLDDSEGSIAPLPLLQVVLHQLWLHRTQGFLTHAAYEETGGVGAALSRVADVTYDQLSSPQRMSARAMLLRMVDPDGRRRFVPVTELDPAERETLDVLVRASVVIIDRMVDEDVATIAHESLARNWPRFASWLEESRDSLRVLLKLEETAREWLAYDRSGEFLYGQLKLQNAEQAIQTEPQMLSNAAREFLNASYAALKTRRWWLRLFNQRGRYT